MVLSCRISTLRIYITFQTYLLSTCMTQELAMNRMFLPFLISAFTQSTMSPQRVFILTTIKRTLTHLSISSNPLITNDAVPALLVLSHLSFLSILDTSIDMHGLRLLAKTIQREERAIDIQIPIVCDEYIDSKFLLIWFLRSCSPRLSLLHDL